MEIKQNIINNKLIIESKIENQKGNLNNVDNPFIIALRKYEIQYNNNLKENKNTTKENNNIHNKINFYENFINKNNTEINKLFITKLKLILNKNDKNKIYYYQNLIILNIKCNLTYSPKKL